jgi:hypothetical protein
MFSHAERTGSSRNLIDAVTATTMKSTGTISCVTLNGGSDWVGAMAFRRGHLPKELDNQNENIR